MPGQMLSVPYRLESRASGERKTSGSAPEADLAEPSGREPPGQILVNVPDRTLEVGRPEVAQFHVARVQATL